MPTTSQLGISVVFGLKDRLPIANAPEGAKVRVRLRNNSIGRAFVKYPDRIEQWTLGYDGNKMAGATAWVLKFKEGVNFYGLEH